MEYKQNILLFALVICSALSCKRNYSHVKKIDVVVDIDNKRNDRHTIELTNRDSIYLFMEKFNNRKSTWCKFSPKYHVEIYYATDTDVYYCSGNCIRDTFGRAYELVDGDWTIYDGNVRR